jgi:hypothetical protein
VLCDDVDGYNTGEIWTFRFLNFFKNPWVWKEYIVYVMNENETLTIQIGNSDNKLTQSEWSEFVWAVRNILRGKANVIHFFGGSVNWAEWQNVCWVAEVPFYRIPDLKEQLSEIGKAFKQDGVAVTVGVTEFV